MIEGMIGFGGMRYNVSAALLPAYSSAVSVLHFQGVHPSAPLL